MSCKDPFITFLTYEFPKEKSFSDFVITVSQNSKEKSGNQTEAIHDNICQFKKIPYHIYFSANPSNSTAFSLSKKSW